MAEAVLFVFGTLELAGWLGLGLSWCLLRRDWNTDNRGRLRSNRPRSHWHTHDYSRGCTTKDRRAQKQDRRRKVREKRVLQLLAEEQCYLDENCRRTMNLDGFYTLLRHIRIRTRLAFASSFFNMRRTLHLDAISRRSRKRKQKVYHIRHERDKVRGNGHGAAPQTLRLGVFSNRM